MEDEDDGADADLIAGRQPHRRRDALVADEGAVLALQIFDGHHVIDDFDHTVAARHARRVERQREVTVAAIDANGPRARVTTHVVGRGTGREFLGFNRARHAVLEASIIASRARWLPAAEIRPELERLQVLVDKTAGPREHEAMELVRQHVRAAVGSG